MVQLNEKPDIVDYSAQNVTLLKELNTSHWQAQNEASALTLHLMQLELFVSLGLLSDF